MVIISDISAQDIKRQCVGSYGSGAVIDGFFINQTIGQSFSTLTYIDDKVRFSPGFQQVLIFSRFKQPENLKAPIPLIVFPNPSAGGLFIETTELIENATVTVFDETGRLIFQENLPYFDNYHIDCSRWQNGFYFLTLTKGNKYNGIYKVIVSK